MMATVVWEPKRQLLQRLSPIPTKVARLTADAEADPLLLARLAGRDNGNANLLVALVEILHHLLRLLFDLGHGHVLLHDERVHVLEELGELDHLALDLLQSSMAVLDGREGGAGLAAAVRLHESLGEDLASGDVLDGGADLLLGRLGPDDAVLPGHLVLHAPAELGLELLILLDGRLETAVDAAHLGAVLREAAVRIRLHLAHAFREAAVHGHRLGRQRIQLPVRRRSCRRVGVVQRPLLQHPQLFEVLLDGVDAPVNLPTLVQDRVRVAATAAASAVATVILRQPRHLDVACGPSSARPERRQIEVWAPRLTSIVAGSSVARR